MNTLAAWAARWGISPDALRDLEAMMVQGTDYLVKKAEAAASSEMALVAQVRMSASRKGKRLFRNNVGAGKLENGSFVRWGLCNDSANLNDKVKSSDLVGISPVIIGPEHLGHKLGVFTAREVKRPGWKYRGTAEEQAQLRFIQLVQGLGGDACFTTNPEGDL